VLGVSTKREQTIEPNATNLMMALTACVYNLFEISRSIRSKIVGGSGAFALQ
jgi:hypothetical protein